MEDRYTRSRRYTKECHHHLCSNILEDMDGGSDRIKMDYVIHCEGH